MFYFCEMIKETSIQDPELGVITLRFNSRAIHYSLHVTNGRRIIATVPKTGSLPEVLRFVEQVRVKLRLHVRLSKLVEAVQLYLDESH